MKKNIIIDLELEEKESLAKALEVVNKIAYEIDVAGSYKEIEIAYCSIDENHNFETCMDEMYSAVRNIYNYLLHHSN